MRTGVCARDGLSFVLTVQNVLLHLHKAVIKIQEPDLVYYHLEEECVFVCECVTDRQNALNRGV